MSRSPSTYLPWVTPIRIIASFLVVVIHVCSPLLTRYGQIPLSEWQAGNLYDSAARVAVPLFIMLSGALLLGKQEPLSVYFRKRFTKVLIPLVAWSLIYIVFSAAIDGAGITPKKLIKLLYSPAYYHLWFLYTLVGLYLLIPILRSFIQNAERNLWAYFVGLWFFAASVVPLLTSHYQFTWLPDLSLVTGFSGYLVLGYLLANTESPNKLRIFGSLAAISGAIATFLLTYSLTIAKQEFVGTFYEYLSPTVILSAAGLFAFLKSWKVESGQGQPSNMVINALGDASFGVYLFHIIPLTLLERGIGGFQLTGWSFTPWLAVPLTAAVVYALSLVVVLATRKIPYLRAIAP